MRHSKRSLEGELVIDHRASPGLGPEEARWMGVDPSVVAEGQVFEAPFNTCAHCQAMVVINPNRQRERAWCAKCDKYVCDECDAVMRITLACRNVEKRLDQLREEVELGISPLLLTRL